MRDNFLMRLRAAARGERPQIPHPVDEVMRALVRQLQGGPPAPSQSSYQIVGAKREPRGSKG